jgi:endonuclease/exonuclease/phosphatase family metal-dependent hydrolase
VIFQHSNRGVLNINPKKLIEQIMFVEESLLKDKAFIERFGAKTAIFKANLRLYIALHLALSKKHRLKSANYLLKALACSSHALRSRAFYGTLKRVFM